MSEAEVGSHLSTAVFPTATNSAASSSHSAAPAAGSGPSSRLGQVSYALADHDEGSRAGQLPDYRTGRFETALGSGNQTGPSTAGAHDLAAVSHANDGRRGILVISGNSNLDSNKTSAVMGACNKSEVADVPHSQSWQHDVATSADGSTAADGAPSQGLGHLPGLLQTQQRHNGSAAAAQPPEASKTDSSKSASEVILLPIDSAGHQTGPSADGASASGQDAPAPEHSAFAEQSQPESLVSQAPQLPEQVAYYAATPLQAEGHRQAVPVGSQAEQRNLEEQEVLYNMTGQTGSLMYMAPEVRHLHVHCAQPLICSTDLPAFFFHAV